MLPANAINKIDMKTIRLLTLLTFITMISCKKDRFCLCSSQQVPQLEAHKTFNDKRKHAKSKCADLETEMRATYPDIVCKLQ